jgi:hypothetical protein
VSKIDEFKKKYKIQSVEEEEEQKASSSPIEEFKKKYNITTTDEADRLGSYERSKRESKTAQVISSNFDRMGSSTGIDGYKKYLEDEEAKKTAPKYDLNNDGQDAWWEKALGYLGGGGGGVVDTELPTAGVTQAVHDLREDESYRRPNNDWSVKQKAEFGELYLTSPESAFAYAEKTNKQNNKRKEESEIDKIQREATKNFGYGVGHTVGAIATAPLGLADYLGDLAYAAAGRDIAPDGSVSPFEYSQAVTGGISEHLNEEVGTLPEDWWMVGGKGLGDVYGLGTSIAQSMASAYTLGGVGTLVSYFGQAAAAGVDDAIARGASDDQALLYGAVLGTFEGVAEKIGIDNLFKLGSTSTIKGLIKNILKQAGAEGGEELFTAVTSEIADRWIMVDKSNFNILVEALMAQGMSEADAKMKAFVSTLGDIAFDTIAGAVSGSVSGGIHSGVQTAITNADAKANYSGQAQDMVSEALASEDADTRTVGEKYQKKLNDNKKLSGWDISHLLETTDTQKVKSAVEAQLTKLGESGDVSALAEVITKQTQGIELSKKEKAILDGSKFGQRVVNTLDRENIKTGEYDTRWAKGIGTRRLNADVYNKITDNLLLEAPIVNIAGYEKAWQNIGKMRNSGVELSLNALLINKKRFQWSMNANFSKNVTEILELGQNGAPIYLGVTCLSGQNAIILKEGGSVGDIYGYETIGVYGLNDFEANGTTPKPGVPVETGAERPGAMKFKDEFVDGKITAEDRKVIGNTLPDFFGAFGTDLTWGDFNLHMQFNYSYGADVYNANYNILAKFNSNSYNQMAFYKDRWSKDNLTSTQYVSMTNDQVCLAFVEDASYLRLKTLRLTWNLPSRWFGKKSHIGSIRTYISADNLFVLTRYSGYDPEVYSKQGSTSSSSTLTSGFDYGVFPRARTFTLGFNFIFR